MKGTLLLLYLTLVAPLGAQEADTLDFLFKSGTEGYECFRIPSLVTTVRGTLLAFAEGRKRGCSDTGDIDLVMKRSEDQGRSWSPLHVIRDDGRNVCGNPAPVVDERTGTIHLLSTWNLGEDQESTLIEPICQASLLSVYLGKRDMHRLYFLNTAHEDKRQNLTLRTSLDLGRSWPESKVLHRGPGAYSDLTLLDNGNLGCLFEAGHTSPYEGIVFLEILP